MQDLVMIGLTGALAALAWAMAVGCARLGSAS